MGHIFHNFLKTSWRMWKEKNRRSLGTFLIFPRVKQPGLSPEENKLKYITIYQTVASDF